MRQKIIVGILSVLCSSNYSYAANRWNGRILDVKNQSVLTLVQLAERMANFEYVVLGEKHYTKSVQEAEANLIEGAVIASGSEGRFTAAWEFLNFSALNSVINLFEKFKTGTISAGDFLLTTQGNPMSYSYAPILETTKRLHGDIFAPNLSSKEKAPIVKGGIATADPAIIPPGFVMGGDHYRERFAEAMGGHTPAEKLDNYFAAQCLTDDYMAYQIAENLKTPLKVMIVGSFHTDYLDGFVKRLTARTGPSKVLTVKIIDSADFIEEELLLSLNHERYGEVADFVYFVNEPKI